MTDHGRRNGNEGTPENRQDTARSWILFAYVLFVVYGSLVPLDFHALPRATAWDAFQHIRMYQLGIASRADWISNGVLYVPVGFLTAHFLIQKHSRTRQVLLMMLAGVFSVALAFGVEFAQVFFPPRTVSLNDLLAESIGSVVGIFLAAKYSGWFGRLVQAGFVGTTKFATYLLEAYLVGYIAFSLFPYDLLLSAAELSQKLHGDNWGWLLASGDGKGVVLRALKLFSETFLTLPFGLFLGSRSATRSPPYTRAIVVGALLGGSLEVAQFFTASGVSEGLSVLTRIAGVSLGLALWRYRSGWSPERLALLLRRFSLPLGAIYLLMLLQVNGWFSHKWTGFDHAMSRLGDLHFIPFYYHYFTTEAKALFSLASVALMYAPIGLFCWSNRNSPRGALLLALATAAVVETGKLFLKGLHPDPSNLIVGALAALGAVHLARRLSEAVSLPETMAGGSTQNLQTFSSTDPGPSARKGATAGAEKKVAAHVLLICSLAFAGYWAATFPTQPVLLLVFLAACAAIIWHRPMMFLVIIPAALPVLDLAPWSGRFYLDEFDLLLLVGLSIGYARVRGVQKTSRHTDLLFAAAGSLVAISFVIGALRGLLPWQTIDVNAFTNYYSAFNALRIGKGALWAFLSFGLLRRMAAADMRVGHALAVGMSTGLALTVALVLWERLTFASLIGFDSNYRVTGLFSAMHIGGAYVECYLAVAAPFLMLLTLESKDWLRRLLGSIVLVATTYALMVTFSRNGYLAYCVALGIFLFFALFKSSQGRRRLAFLAALGAAMVAVALPIFTGRFAQDRMATIRNDYAARYAHWGDSLNMRTRDWPTFLFGMGLGRYPESHYFLNRDKGHSGAYQLKKEGETAFLRLTAGEPIYVEQIVPVQPHENYRLKLKVRSNQPGAKLLISLCEKSMLASFQCIVKTARTGAKTSAWVDQEFFVATGSVGEGPWFARKNVKLALHIARGGSQIDITNVRLETTVGENLLLNGNFSNALDHWFFSEEAHLPWHTHSMPVTLLFDQGWLGLVALCVASLVAIRRASVRAWQGDADAAAAMAALCSFLVVGMFDTLIDAPRFLFLALLLGRYCGIPGGVEESSAAQRAVGH